jgi:hypothetical protein
MHIELGVSSSSGCFHELSLDGFIRKSIYEIITEATILYCEIMLSLCVVSVLLNRSLQISQFHSSSCAELILSLRMVMYPFELRWVDENCKLGNLVSPLQTTAWPFLSRNLFVLFGFGIT